MTFSPTPNPEPPTPVVILVRPQMGENIGAVARAMANFGLKELRLAAPRDGWPNPKAVEMSAGAETIIETTKTYHDFTSAMADIHLAYATTARPRDMEKRVLEPPAAIADIRQHSEAGKKIALVFGPERTGLENEEISWCDTLITIPTAPEKRSINIAQAAVIIGYEWWRQQSERQDVSLALDEMAPKAEWEAMFSQLESYLDQADYFRAADRKPTMWLNLRNMLMRSRMSEQELRSFRGLIRSLWESQS